jgi:hypothetical protein
MNGLASFCVIAVIIMVFLVGMVNGLPTQKISITEGKNIVGTNNINLTDGKVQFIDTITGVSVEATTLIDGVEFKPELVKTTNGDVIWGTGEKSIFFLDDPTVQMVYNYSGSALKETITLKEDKELSFPIKLGKDSKLIDGGAGTWRIISASSGNTMAGIIITKPYGIDSNGNEIEMEYQYKAGALDLVYNKTIITYALEKGNITPFYSQIQYPLIIDPTWMNTSGCWTTKNGNQTVIMWNSTGNSTWTPKYFYNMTYLLIGGGGSGGQVFGGGGGAGGVVNGTLSVINGTTYNISVGSGGVYAFTNYTLNDGVNGTNSTFGNASITYVARGGGAGGGGMPNLTWYEAPVAGKLGASGGGGTRGGVYGLNNTTQGNRGGNGTNSSGCLGGCSAGGGGGWGANGTPAVVDTSGSGGVGRQNNITGNNSYYAGGGGGGDDKSAFGAGGAGGGGRGGYGTQIGISGVAGTGGGGGGGGWGGEGWATYMNPGSGGSGVFIVSFSYSEPWLNHANFTATNTSHPGDSVAFTDTSKINITDNLTYLWEFGDGYTSSTVGNVTHVYSWTGVFSVNLSVNTSVGINDTLFRSEWMIVTTDTGDVAVNNTRQVSYSPRTVTFKIIDEYNTPLINIPVDGYIDSYTFPNGAADLVNYYGLSLEAAQNAVNESFILHGETDSLGQVTYTMLGAIKYTVNVTSGGTTYSKYIYPSTDTYIITIPSFVIPTPATNYITYTLTNNTVNSTVEYFNLTYRDTSGGTSSINFTVKNQSGAILYTTVVSGFGTTQQNLSSGQLTHIAGDTYIYSFTAPQSQIGSVNVTQSITWGVGNTLIGFPNWVAQWIAIGLLVLLTAAFSILSKRFALIIIPVITFFMMFYMGWIVPTVGTYAMMVSLGIIFTLGVLVYIQERGEER